VFLLDSEEFVWWDKNGFHGDHAYKDTLDEQHRIYLAGLEWCIEEHQQDYDIEMDKKQETISGKKFWFSVDGSRGRVAGGHAGSMEHI
jgi:hypothetical protein